MIKINHYRQKKEKFARNARRTTLFIFISTTVVWSFFWLPYFKISEIEISDSLINKHDVEEKLSFSLSSLTRFFLPRNNLFLFSSKIAENAILDSGLGVADIEKKFPNKIYVKFKEIKPKFLYCNKNECFYIDKNGIPYESAPIFSDSPIPILESNKNLRLGEEFLENYEADFLIKLKEKIQKLGLTLKKIKIENDIKLTTNEGWQLILILGEKDHEKIVEKLYLLFERQIKDRSKLEYIDIRFPNKVFYKLSP